MEGNWQRKVANLERGFHQFLWNVKHESDDASERDDPAGLFFRTPYVNQFLQNN